MKIRQPLQYCRNYQDKIKLMVKQKEKKKKGRVLF